MLFFFSFISNNLLCSIGDKEIILKELVMLGLKMLLSSEICYIFLIKLFI